MTKGATVLPIHLNGAVPDADRDIVTIGDSPKEYRLRPLTRATQQKVGQVYSNLDDLTRRALQENEAFDMNAGYDERARIYAEGIDALLEINGSHRTPASKLILELWETEKITLTQIEGYFEQLQAQELEARPT